MINLGFGVLCGFSGVGFFGGAALVLWEFFLFVFWLLSLGVFFLLLFGWGFFVIGRRSLLPAFQEHICCEGRVLEQHGLSMCFCL